MFEKMNAETEEQRERERKLFGAIDSYRTLERYVAEMLASEISDRCGVLVSGEKGTGKTSFIEHVIQSHSPRHPFLIVRHNQQHQKIPYFGFKYGISDYLSKIYSEFDDKELERFSTALKHHLGTSFPLLFDYIPELSLITGEEARSAPDSIAGIENQVFPLFKRLFEFLSHFAGNRLIFFTDDLQWMDASGVSLLKYLLSSLSPDKMIWVGAYRMAPDTNDSLEKLDEELARESKRIEMLTLEGLSVSETRVLLESRLGGICDDNLVEACFRLSGGSLSRLHFLIDSLRADGYLRRVGEVWMTDDVRIESLFSTDHSDSIFIAGLQRLSNEAQELLSVMATMGRYNRQVLLEWFDDDGTRLDALVEEAVSAGLINRSGGDVHFSEMRIGERIYNSLSDERRIALHHRIGQSFFRRGIDTLTSTAFILMTTHFNHALDRLRADGQVQVVAELNFEAGKRSQQENALEQARHFFRVSAELLRECSWADVMDQVFRVYMERARVEYELGEYDLAEIHLDYLLSRIADPVQRAPIFELKVTINNHLGRYIKVVRILEEALGDLGMRLPLDESSLRDEVRKLSARLAGDETPETDNPAERLDVCRRKAILKLLYVGGMGLHHNSDVLMRWAALQIILCSGKETISGVKAIGCVSYGRMLIIAGEIEKGYAFGLRGLQINDELQDLALRCRVYGVYSFYIQPWKRPFEDSYRFLERAQEAGRSSGDLIGLYIVKTHRLNLHVVSGLPLHQLPRLDFEESYPGRELTYYITHYQKSLLDFLMGKSQVFTMPRQQPAWLAGELTIQEEKFYRNYVWARYYFLFGHYELAAAAAQEADCNRKLQEGSPLLPANLYTWFLAITQNWTNYDDSGRRAMEPVLDRIRNSFALWQEEGPSNYGSMWHLLRAEAARIEGRLSDATDGYALSASTAHSNVYHRAVTHELWARFLLNASDQQSEASHHLAEAIRHFHAWGALAKVRQLVWQYQAIVPLRTVTDFDIDQEIDIETIQHELSGDMEVSSLVKKLMVLLLRVSGSTHVVVELVKDTGDPIEVDSLSLFQQKKQQMSADVPFRAGFPMSLVMMAVKSHNTVVVNDLDAERGFRGLDMIRERGVQSFLILPVTINGHLSMVIYLESIFASNWYVADRVRWVRIAANQGAVIIENARTHERAVKLNEELRREMTEKERLAALVEAQKDAHLRAVVETQDHERKRIAGDLHDSLGSLLSTVKLRFDALQEDFHQRIPEKSVRFEETMRMLDDAIGEVRQISHNMLPVSLTRFGLRAALENFVARINASAKLQADLQIFGLDRRLPENMEVAAYRICQELVQNVIRHAEASYTSIQLIDHTDVLNIIVEDDGKGMEVPLISEGFGFTTIRSKVGLFKGRFDVESRPGQGTMAVVDLPVKHV